MKTLDRSRPFGTIYPVHEGAAYEQDGLFFDAQGKQCGAEPPPASQTGLVGRRGRPRKSVPEATEAPAEAPVDPVSAEVAAQLAEDED